MNPDDTMKRGERPTVDQWSQLKSEGWTVESWNAEMDERRRDNASNRWATVIFTALIVVFFYFAVMS